MVFEPCVGEDTQSRAVFWWDSEKDSDLQLIGFAL